MPVAIAEMHRKQEGSHMNELQYKLAFVFIQRQS